MHINLNGSPMEIETNSNLEHMLDIWGYQKNMFAVAINKCFVAREHYAATILQTGDEVAVVSPMQGG